MAKEYIEREAVKFAYEMSLKNDTHRTEEASRIHAQEHRHILHLLDKIPAADVVEVVRCKDCEWWEDCSVESYCHNPYGLDNYALPDDFCSNGKRRDK